MTDTDLLKNTRNTRNTTGIGWDFSLCTADEGDSDSEPEDASTGSHSSPAPSPDPPVSDELRFVRDFDLAARQDTAIFKSNPWTIAKLRAATRKPPPMTPYTGLSGLPPVPHEALTSTPTPKPRSTLDPYVKKCAQPQPTSCSKKPSNQKRKLPPPRTKGGLSSVANPKAAHPNSDHILGVPSICSHSVEIHSPGKTTNALLAQPHPSTIVNRDVATSREQKEIRSSRFEMRSKEPPFPRPGENPWNRLRVYPHLVVLVPVKPLLGHSNASLSPVEQPSLRSTPPTRAPPSRFSFLSDPLFLLPRPFTGNSSDLPSTSSPIKPRSPAALSVNHAGTKRKRLPSPRRSTGSVGNGIVNRLSTTRSPGDRIIPPKTPVHRQRAPAYNSKAFDSADGEWSTLPQKKLRTSASTAPKPLTQNPFHIPGLKLPGIGNQTSNKSWLLTTFRPPPLPTLEATEALKDDGQVPPLEDIVNSSSQTVVENEPSDDGRVYLDEFKSPPLSTSFSPDKPIRYDIARYHSSRYTVGEVCPFHFGLVSW